VIVRKDKVFHVARPELDIVKALVHGFGAANREQFFGEVYTDDVTVGRDCLRRWQRRCPGTTADIEHD
jgi:hypothetical protein